MKYCISLMFVFTPLLALASPWEILEPIDRTVAYHHAVLTDSAVTGID